MQTIRSGMILMFSATLFFGAGNLFAKLSSREISSWETVFFRAIGGLLIATLILYARGKRFTPVNKKLLFYRGITGALSLSCYFYGLKTTGLTKATLLTYTFPIFGTVFTRLIYKEKPGRFFWPLFVVAMFGIVLILSPGQEGFQFLDLIPLAGGVLAGIAITTVRQLRHTDRPETVFAAFMLFCLLVSGGFALPRITVYQADTYAWLLAMILTTSIAQIQMSRAYHSLPVALGSVIQLLTVFFSALFAIVFLREPHTANTLLGGMLVLTATAAIILTRNRPATGERPNTG